MAAQQFTSNGLAVSPGHRGRGRSESALSREEVRGLDNDLRLHRHRQDRGPARRCSCSFTAPARKSLWLRAGNTRTRSQASSVRTSRTRFRRRTPALAILKGVQLLAPRAHVLSSRTMTFSRGPAVVGGALNVRTLLSPRVAARARPVAELVAPPMCSEEPSRLIHPAAPHLHAPPQGDGTARQNDFLLGPARVHDVEAVRGPLS